VSQTPDIAKHNTDAFERLLWEERQWNARCLNGLRPAGLTLFLVLQFAIHGSTRGAWVLVGYWVLAVALFVAARKSDVIARWSALAVPFLDMPAVFLKQWLDMDLPDALPRAVATFTLGPLLLLVMLSAFTLRTTRLILAGCVAAGLELALQFKAEDTLVGKVGGVTTILLAVVLCEVALSRRIVLAHKISAVRLHLEKLGRYFSPKVAEVIQQSDDDFSTGRLFEITVLFSDLRGFAATAECSQPAELIGLLNEFHSRMVEAVFAHQGTLDKYIGDGLMAYFGAPVAQPDHALRALRCALEMQAALAELNRTRILQDKPSLRLSIGLHTGPAVVGTIGAANRREFTAVGDTVNLAARLENLTRYYDATVLLSGETARNVGDTCEVVFLAETYVKGRSERVRLFAPAPQHHVRPLQAA